MPTRTIIIPAVACSQLTTFFHIFSTGKLFCTVNTEFANLG